MKFGQNLEQYSVPQWAPYNVDYNNVKKIIRQATLPGSARAISIPGQDTEDELAEGAEQELYLALCEELERIELYSRTKYGEIQRRLEHHSKMLDKLNGRNTADSMKRVQRLSKLEEGVIRAGNDLQLLSRFIGANRLAFVKLLKKYKKWSRSAKLIQRFRQEQLDGCEFLSGKTDPLTVLLSRYTDLLESIRAAFDVKGKAVSIDPESSRQAHALQHAFDHGTQTEFDSVFLASATGGRATYWVHSDNLVQAHVLLQSVSKQRRSSSADSPTSPSKAVADPLNTFGNNFGGSGLIVYGTPDSIKAKMSTNDEMAHVHYTRSDKAVTLSLPGQRLALKRKEVVSLVQTESTASNAKDSPTLKSARSWFDRHPQVKPLIEIGYSRTRLAGFSNSDTCGLWATLDKDIVFSTPGSSADIARFPHSVLDIRWEGKSTPDIIRNLDRQIIAERIPDFDICIHALAATYTDLADPEWLKTLEKDLRRTSVVGTDSAEYRAKAKNSSATTASDQSYTFSTGRNHSSATSTYDTSEITDSVRQTRQKDPRKKVQLRVPREETSKPQVRYWNEFEDGDEEMQAEEPYFVDAQDTNEDILASMFAAFRQKMGFIANSMRWNWNEKAREQEPLLSSTETMSSTSSEAVTSHVAKPRKYSTLADPYALHSELPRLRRGVSQRDSFLFYATWTTYAVAVMFLVMGIVIESIGRRRFSTERRIFSVFGTLMSFLLASLGAICGNLRGREVNVVERGIVMMSYVVLCVADGVLLITIWGDSS